MATDSQITTGGFLPMLTVPEVATLLQLNEFTVRKMARNRALPGAIRLGGTWRFRRREIQRYVEGK